MMLAVLGISLAIARSHAQAAAAPLQTATFRGSSEMLLNPERGFRLELDQGCDGKAAAAARWAATLADVAKYNITVVQTYCYLVAENEAQVPAQLSAEVLSRVAEAFTRLRMGKAKALLRFAYDRAMPGTHKYSASTILGHIKQLAPLVALNDDALYVLQAGFIGSWGEWHSSISNIHANSTAVTEIVEAELFTLLAPDRKLNVRVPVYKLSGALRRKMSGPSRAKKLICDASMAGPCPGPRCPARTACKGAFGGINASTCHALGCCFAPCDGCAECFVGYTFSRPVTAAEPAADRMAYGVATESKSNTAVARVGFDNDGFMSTSTDGGTWGPQYTRSTWDENTDGDSAPFPHMGGHTKGSLAAPTFDTGHGIMADRSYLYASKESAFVPVDGEMFWRAGAAPYDDTWPAHVDAETAAWRLREMHYSTLSLVHGFSELDGTAATKTSKNETIDIWMRTPLNVGRLIHDRLPVSSDYAQGRSHSGFEYVRDHLGYRLELQSATFPKSLSLESSSDLTVTIKSFKAALVNYGFAAPINPRPVYLALLTPDGSGVLFTGSGWADQNETTTSVADVRDWQPFAPGDPTYSSLAHSFGGENIKLYSTHTPTSPFGPAPPPCLKDKAGCALPLALFLPDDRLRKCMKCEHAEAYSIVFANDEQTLNVSTVSGIGRFNVVGKLNVMVKLDDEAIIYLPCFDSDPAFAILKSRQQFGWANQRGQVALLSDRGRCITAVGAPGKEGPLKLDACLPQPAASQDWTTVPRGNRSGLASAASGFTVCGDMPLVSAGSWQKMAVEIPVRRNNRGWLTSNRTHVSGSNSTCLNFDKAASAFRSTERGPPDHGVPDGEANLCLSVGPGIRPCDAPSPAAGFAMCDVTITLAERVADLVARIPAAAKPAQLVNVAPAINSLWIPTDNWWNEALHGLLSGGAISPDRTVRRKPTEYPSAISSSASFNRSLFWKMGQSVGTEARVEDNAGTARGWTWWSPNVNIFRDPRWGRGQETPGESPTLNGEYGALFVSGFQGDESAPANGSAPRKPPARLKASATVKHFFAYSVENCFHAHDNCRFNFNANVTRQEIEDTYLPAFQSTVEVGRVSGLMTSENAVNSIPPSANGWALTTVLRDAWGFEGYVTGDCGAVDAAFAPYPTTHNFTSATEHQFPHFGHGYRPPAGVTGLESAGFDVDCKRGPSQAVGTAADQDAALRHLWAVQFRLGRFDPLSASPYNHLCYELMGSAQHQQLALEAARQGLVLLKNSNQTLPLCSKSPLKVAMLGSTWEVKSGGYSGGGTGGPFTATAASFVSKYAKRPATMVAGCWDVECNNSTGIAAAVAAAATADVVLVAIGIDAVTFEKENTDGRALAADIGLPGRQSELVSKVAAAAKAPITVVVTGSSVDISALKANAKVGAILWRGYSGEAAGMATADVLFGKYNPSGRLTTTWYAQSFVNATWKSGIDPYTGAVNSPANASYFDHHTRPNSTTGNPGRGYRFFTGEPVFRFGEGLSFTTFKHQLVSTSEIAVDAQVVQEYAVKATAQHNFRRDSPLAWVAHTAKVAVSNTGARAGAHSVLAYAVPPAAGVDGAPLRSLIGFEKVWLQPGETRVVAFTLTAHDLTLTASEGGRAAALGLWTVEVGDAECHIRVRADQASVGQKTDAGSDAAPKPP